MALNAGDAEMIIDPRTDAALRCPAYCDCEFPSSVVLTNYKGLIAELVQCRCGEDDAQGAAPFLWRWADLETDAQICGADIIFHPTYSQGTAIVRGELPLQVGMVHFWEMRIITPLSGTDVMFGVGTDKVDLDEFRFHFVSALGNNRHSWGYSYNGTVHHKGQKRPYGKKFSQGCIVGVLLDRSRGHLEFFLNRRSLGVAYTNIPLDPNVRLYPMVCSTPAKSMVRLIHSMSQPDCLQLRSFQALSKQPRALQELRQMPGLRSIMQAYWFLAPPVRYSQRSVENDLDICDEAVLPLSKRMRKPNFKDEEPDLTDLYASVHKIAVRHNENDEEYSTLGDYFDEYFNYLF